MHESINDESIFKKREWEVKTGDGKKGRDKRWRGKKGEEKDGRKRGRKE